MSAANVNPALAGAPASHALLTHAQLAPAAIRRRGGGVGQCSIFLPLVASTYHSAPKPLTPWPLVSPAFLSWMK